MANTIYHTYDESENSIILIKTLYSVYLLNNDN